MHENLNRMKTILRILIFLIIIGCFSFTSTPLRADEGTTPINSTELPSTAFLKKEKRSIAATENSSALVAPMMGVLSASNGWKDPFLPGDGEWSNPGNVGAPIGDISLPIIFSILILYLIYRRVSTSRRRNNF